MILDGLAALVALTAAPFLLPWRQHVRWLVAAVALPDPVGLTFGAVPVTMGEVRVGQVARAVDLIAVEVSETCPPHPPRWYTLVDGAEANIAQARLDRWSAAGASLLLVTGTGEQATLHGPSHAVLGLRPWLPLDAPDGAGPRTGDARGDHPLDGDPGATAAATDRLPVRA